MIFVNKSVKERVHSKMKTFEKVDYCKHIQPITLIFPKIDSIFPDSVSISDIQGPASHHPRTCITPSKDLHHTIQGPASKHPTTYIRASEPASSHPGTCITQSGPASSHPNLHHFATTSPTSLRKRLESAK